MVVGSGCGRHRHIGGCHRWQRRRLVLWLADIIVVIALVVMVGHCRIGGGGGDRGIMVGVGWLSSSWRQLLLLGAVAEGV